MNDIFISYKVHNRKIAIEYYKILLSKQYSVWFDQLVPEGANWKQTIQDQIKNSNLVICLLSKACLLDDWVLFQLEAAHKYHKDVVFITLDDTNWDDYKEYRVKKNIFTQLGDIPLDKYFKSQNYIERQTMGMPILTFGLVTILTCWILLSGIQIMNLSMDYKYGFISLGILGILALSYIQKRIVYLIQSILALGLLAIAMYVLPSYYISGVPVNGIIFVFLYLFTFGLRYTKINIWLGLLLSIFYAIFITTLDASLIVFVKYYFNFDCSWLSFIILVFFLVYQYFVIKKNFVNYKKQR